MVDIRRWGQKIDVSLSALLAVQAATLFVVIPLGTLRPSAHILLDFCNLIFAMVCVKILTRHIVLQVSVIVALVMLATWPFLSAYLTAWFGLDDAAQHEIIAMTAFVFNGAVTVLVARHVFGPGRVTLHRVRGGILLYLNVAALFSIAFSAIEVHSPGAIAPSAGGTLPRGLGAMTASLTYFSLSTITTTGYGDLTPVYPIARSLANLEAVFGQLFPATLLARIVALNLAHQRSAREEDS